MTKYDCEACEDSGEVLVPYYVNGIKKTKARGCQECCPHDEQDHFICLDCGYEGEPSDWYDEDYGQER